MKKSKRSAPWLRHYGKTQLSSNIGKKFPWDFDVLMCVLTHENQVGMQITSQFLSFPSTQPLKYLVFTTSATTRSYEKSQWTRVRFPTRRDIYVHTYISRYRKEHSCADMSPGFFSRISHLGVSSSELCFSLKLTCVCVRVCALWGRISLLGGE